MINTCTSGSTVCMTGCLTLEVCTSGLAARMSGCLAINVRGNSSTACRDPAVHIPGCLITFSP